MDADGERFTDIGGKKKYQRVFPLKINERGIN